MAQREPTFGTINGIGKAARAASKQWASVVGWEQELAYEARQDAKRAEMLQRPSTSTRPTRCPSCAEWNAAERVACRHCTAPL